MEANPSKIIRYDLLVVLVGVACSLAAERFVDKGADLAIRIATAAFFLTSLNFLHAKTITLDDEDYNRVLVNRPGFALLDFLLNVAIVVTFVFLSLYLKMPRMILILNVIVRALDIPLVLLVRQASEEPIIRRAQNSWLLFDIFSILCFGGILLSKASWSHIFVASIFLFIICLDILMDYTVNYHLYFASAGSWKEMAANWDRMQGNSGDMYRQRVVLPALQRAVNFKGKRVLDLGCGNGCIARAAEELGASSVIAIDRHQSMLEMAQQYPSSRISYQQVDVDIPGQSSPAGLFDVIVACFSLQDCDGIREPMQLIRSKLAPLGMAILIYENDEAFLRGGHHNTTSRIPLDSRSYAGQGQRWLISWHPAPSTVKLVYPASKDENPTLEFLAHSEVKPQATVTRYWDTYSFLRQAVSASLALATWPAAIRVHGAAEGSTLRSYERCPRFSMLTFIRNEDAVPESSEPLSLLLIAGVSGTGKTRCAEYLASRVPRCIQLSLDDFSLTIGDPRIPIIGGKPDWESRRSIDMEATAKAVHALVNRQPAQIPIYDMATSTVTGYRTMLADEATLLVVEGVYAFDVFAPGLARQTRLLIKSSLRTLPRRFKRDLYEKRRSLWSALLHTVVLGFRSYWFDRENRELANLSVSCTASSEEIRKLLAE